MPTISDLHVQHNSAAQQTIKASVLCNSMNYATANVQAATVQGQSSGLHAPQ
jgi:hypothetical protein